MELLRLVGRVGVVARDALGPLGVGGLPPRGALCTTTESRIAITGKLMPYGLPVSALIDDGPVVVTIGSLVFKFDNVSALITKNLSVSIGLPAPMIESQ